MAGGFIQKQLSGHNMDFVHDEQLPPVYVWVENE